MDQIAPPHPPETDTVGDFLAQALSDPDRRKDLREALARDPAFLAEVLAGIGEKHVLRRVIRNPNRVLPHERAQSRLPPPYAGVGFAAAGLKRLIEAYQFQTVLDVGAGAGKHARVLRDLGKTVTKLDFGVSHYAREAAAAAESADDIPTILADANAVELGERFDCVWASHVLEHQPDAGAFLRRLRGWAREGDGIIAVTVPPLKFDLVGGHLSLWTPGHLIYNLVFAGIDCSDAELYHYGYNITAIVRNRSATLPSLAYDGGDVNLLRRFMPPNFREGVDGFAVAKGL
jgi:SAM-dependent methyltransferase